MNWFKSDTLGIDSYISNNFYGSQSNTCGINLRLEMQNILKNPSCGKGHYIAYRRYDRMTQSEYYSKYTKEAKGGPAHEYTDTAIITRRVPIGFKGEEINRDKPGITIKDSFVYYFEYNVCPKRGDHIFELSSGPEEQLSEPDLTSLEYVERYIIASTHPYRLHKGRIEYWSVIAEYDGVGY